MKPCANVEALEALALGDGREAGDAWLEAHVGECAACAAELDRLLEERALFVLRARAQDASYDATLDTDLGAASVFAELDRRRERFRKSGVLASMLAAAAACVAMAFAPVTSPGVRTVMEPAQADALEHGATASLDEAPMTMRVAACMPSGHDRDACDAPAEARAASAGLSAMSTMLTRTGAWSTWPTACVADVTCSVAGP